MTRAGILAALLLSIAPHVAYAQQVGCTTLSLVDGCTIWAEAVKSVPQILPNGSLSGPALAWASQPQVGIFLDTAAGGTAGTLGIAFSMNQELLGEFTGGGNLSLTGRLSAASASISGNLTIGGTFSANTLSAATLSGTTITGTNLSITGSLSAPSAAFAVSSLTAGTVTATTISGGTITGTNETLTGNLTASGGTISANAVSTGTVTATTVSAGTLTGGNETLSGNLTASSGTITAATISAGAIAGTAYTGGSMALTGTLVANAVRLTSTGTQPTCSSATRFEMWTLPAASGARDQVEICIQTASGYAWSTVVSSP